MKFGDPFTEGRNSQHGLLSQDASLDVFIREAMHVLMPFFMLPMNSDAKWSLLGTGAWRKLGSVHSGCNTAWSMRIAS